MPEPAPKPAPAQPSAEPDSAPTPVPAKEAAPANGAVLLQEDFEQTKHGVVPDNPPAGTNGKVLKLEGYYPGQYLAAKFTTADSAVLRFRYWSAKAHSLTMSLDAATGSSAWQDNRFAVSRPAKAGEWETVEIPLREFLCCRDKHPLPGGLRAGQLNFKADSNAARVFIDDIEIRTPVK